MGDGDQLKVHGRVGVAQQRLGEHGGEGGHVDVHPPAGQHHVAAAQLVGQHQVVREKLRGSYALQ